MTAALGWAVGKINAEFELPPRRTIIREYRPATQSLPVRTQRKGNKA